MKRILFVLFFIILTVQSVPGFGQLQPLAPTATPFSCQLALLDTAQTLEQAKTPEQIMSGPVSGKAFLLSFLLPGCGEWYAGSPKMAKIFFGSEVVLWATYIAFKTQENWYVDDYTLFAVSHAGIDPSDKEHDYFVNIENFSSLRDYNEAKLRQRNPAVLYPETDEYNWEWDSDANRKSFEDMRIKADDAKNHALLVIGGIVINHVVSGIDAARVARKAQKKNMSMQYGVQGLPEGGVQLSMQLKF